MSEQQLAAALFTALGTLVGVLVKWILDQFSESRRLRREDKAAIGRLMADLITIWRHQEALVTTFARLRGLVAPLEMPIETQLELEGWVTRLLPDLESVRIRYKEGVGVVAGSDPLLAARMQGMMEYLGQFRSILVSHRTEVDGAAPAPVMALFSEINQQIQAKELNTIRRHILALARLHGLMTLFRTWRYLNKARQTSPEAEEFLSRFHAVLEPYKGESAKPPQVQGA
jgi:hypothetical protein